jgi:membrane protein DedA with SNARE-associated domain
VAELAAALLQFLIDWGYLAVFVIIIIEEAGAPLPLPSEAALLYAGYLVATGELNPLVAGLVATAAAACGSAILYALARRGGRPLMRRWGRYIHLSEARLALVEGWMARAGLPAVLVARLVPGLRIVTTVVAGLARVPLRTTVAAVLGASLLWSYAWIVLGRLLGANWEAGLRAFERAGRWGLLAAAIVGLVALLLGFLLRRRAGAPASGPPALG